MLQISKQRNTKKKKVKTTTNDRKLDGYIPGEAPPPRPRPPVGTVSVSVEEAGSKGATCSLINGSITVIGYKDRSVSVTPQRTNQVTK